MDCQSSWRNITINGVVRATPLLTTTKPRKIQKDGIYFKGLRYFSTNLIAYITEEVFIRYDPQDISEIRVYLNNQFLSIAYCSDLENQSISIKEIERLRANKKRELGKIGYRSLKKQEEFNGLEELVRLQPRNYEIDLIIIDEVDRLNYKTLEIIRDIYDQLDIGVVLIGMLGTEKRLSRYPQLYSRIGFSHQFEKLSNVRYWDKI